MYTVIRVLNNNALLAYDEKKKQEVVFLGKGIGFQRKAQDTFHQLQNTKQYNLHDATKKGSFAKIFDEMNPIFLEISDEIMKKAEERFKIIDTNILLPLSDHIAFAIERMKQDMEIRNPFANDIRLLYPEEYSIAQYGKNVIQEKTGYEVNDDEVGYITLHIHSAIEDEQVSNSMQIAIALKETMQVIEKEFALKIDYDSLSYSRLITHIKYMLARVKRKEVLNLDMDRFVKEQFPEAYQMAQVVCKQLEHLLKISLGNAEVGYLALHMERITKKDGSDNDKE